MVKKKSLAEELAELINPAPTKELDPEADVFGAGPVVEESEDELDQGPTTRRRAKEGKRIAADIEMDGKEYSGRKASMSKLLGDGFDGFQMDQGTDDDDSQSDDGDEDFDDEAPSEDEIGKSHRRGTGNGHHMKKRKSPTSDSEDESDDDYSNDDDDRVNDGELAALEQELEEIKQSEVEAASHLKERAVKERQKALAVKAQKSVWHKALEVRILLQRALTGANKLSQNEIDLAQAAEEDEDVAEKCEKLASTAAKTLEEILDMMESLCEQNPGHAEAAVQYKSSDDIDEEAVSGRLWQQLDEAYQKFVPFRDASIDRWHRKTVLGGGAGKSNLKALNQSVSSQVEQLMKDSERLIQRTRLPVRKRQKIDTEEEQDGTQDAGGAGEVDRDPETYDDTEFYQTLLKEFLDSKSDALGGNWYTGPKNRKVVDRRASKGRKLRYHVHEKLVNFMMPTELDAPKFAANIFANLFGGGGQ